MVSITPSNNGVEKHKVSSADTIFVHGPSPQNIPDIFGTIGRWLKSLVGKKRKEIPEYQAFVVDLKLDRTEVIKDCRSESHSNESQQITLSPVIDNRMNDVITYYYFVNGGRIVDATPHSDKPGFYRFPVGKGLTAIWDLSDTPPGVYKITSGVDDGCGLCGQTVTKEVKVLPCPSR
jgi:hypothetical protein